MKTRNEIYGGTFSSPEAPDTNANGELKKLVLSDSADITKNRSSWIRTIFYNILDSFTHKTEDRATAANLGVTEEPTTTKYVTVEQLPDIISVIDDFTIPFTQADGSLLPDQAMFEVVSDTSEDHKVRFFSFSEFGIKWLKARTWLQSELVALINTTIYGSTETTGLIPVGTIWDYCGLDDPDGFINLCLTGSVRSISKASGAGTLKNDNYQNLFIKLYLSYADTRCPVSGGRSGADATAALNDFVSGKAISLPDYRGRVGGYYKLGDDNFGEVGKPIGTDLIEAAHLPENSPWEALDLGHSHTYNDMRYNNSKVGENAGGGEDARVDENFSTPSTSGNANIEMQPNVSLDRKHFQPTIIQTAIIKY